jgi:hypothetical protein
MEPITMRIRSLVLLGFVAVSGLAISAPAVKQKEEKLGPPTEKELSTAENNLKQIALAWHNFESVNGNLPSNVQDKGGKAILSWRVQILPYIEEEGLYKQFKLDEPWDSAHNKKLVDKMPKLLAPIRVKVDPGMTFYQSFTGKNAVFKPGQKLTFANIPDGTSNTFMVAEAAKPVIWTQPVDLPFDGKDLPALGGHFDGKFHAVFCDGSVFRYKKGIDADLLSRLIDPADGQVIDTSGAIDNDKD